MNLADRLRAVVNPSASAAAASPSPAIQIQQSAAGTRPPHPVRSRSADLARGLGGEWREGSPGRSFVVARRHPPDAPHGDGTIGTLAARLRGAAAAAPLVSAAGARSPFVFFDLETTGLSGGAGTYAFLVGCGWFDAAGAFVTEQHLLIDFAAERAMLQAVAGELGRAGALVSFNGKSFDAPVLETRYAYHRLPWPAADRPHIDVLHPARRFWINEESCSLGTLERQVLGMARIGDVPGFEIPARYFQFIRSGDPRPLGAVLEHNRLDLLSLAGLTARLLHLIDAGPSATSDPREAVALGRVYTRGGCTGRAAESFEHALRLCDGTYQAGLSRMPLKIEALRSLAIAARRARGYETAAARWRQLIELPGCPRSILSEATEALAIHHEHRARDLAAAKMFALRTLEIESGAAWGDAVRHRLARIERKLVSERPLFPS